MKGNWPTFNDFSGGRDGSGGSGKGVSGYVNGKDYNTAESSRVRQVDSVTTVSDNHSMPITYAPNSVIKNYKGGKLNAERYFDEDGKPYLDIDYSDHGNPKMHPNVPHQHNITFGNGKIRREKSDGRIE